MRPGDSRDRVLAASCAEANPEKSPAVSHTRGAGRGWWWQEERSTFAYPSCSPDSLHERTPPLPWPASPCVGTPRTRKSSLATMVVLPCSRVWTFSPRPSASRSVPRDETSSSSSRSVVPRSQRMVLPWPNRSCSRTSLRTSVRDSCRMLPTRPTRLPVMERRRRRCWRGLSTPKVSRM